MIDYFGLSGEAAIPLLGGLLLFWGFIRVIGNRKNPVEYWHFFAAYNERSGKEYGDINSLGMMAGIVGSLFVIMWLTYKGNDINPYVLGVCLVYLGGVKMFAGWLRIVAGRRFAGPAELPPAPPAQREVTHTTSDKTITQEPR